MGRILNRYLYSVEMLVLSITMGTVLCIEYWWYLVFSKVLGLVSVIKGGSYS